MNSSYLTADGTRLVWHELGTGRPLLLLHGYFSDAATNWIKYGTAVRLADAGFRCIMPDLRAHGLSDKPDESAFYPPDVLARDQLGLIDHLGLTDYDIAGYSLGGRTVARMLAHGATPARAIIAGMGLEGLTNTRPRSDHFRNIFAGLGTHQRGSPEWMAEAFLKTTGGDPIALRLLLDANVDTPRREIASWALPIQILVGADDDDNGSGAELAKLLQNGTLSIISGNHMSAVTKPEFGAEMLEFLQKDR
jgi:pimeloyl-ACP methyl ester carboxylesterase